MSSPDQFQQAQQAFDQFLPPTAKRKVYERIALKIREFAGVALDKPLDIIRSIRSPSHQEYNHKNRQLESQRRKFESQPHSRLFSHPHPSLIGWERVSVRTGEGDHWIVPKISNIFGY